MTLYGRSPYFVGITTMQVFSSVARLADRPLEIRISVHHYDSVGSLQNPNHLNPNDCDVRSFVIGTDVVVSRDTPARKQQPSGSVDLGFGLHFTEMKKPTQTRKESTGKVKNNKLPVADGVTAPAKKPRKRPAVDASSVPAYPARVSLTGSLFPVNKTIKAGLKAGFIDWFKTSGMARDGCFKQKTQTSNKWPNVVDPELSLRSAGSSEPASADLSCLSVEEKISLQENDPTNLTPAAQWELEQVVQSLSKHESEVEQHSQSGQDPVPAPARKLSRFSDRLGITALTTAKKSMICYTCSRTISILIWKQAHLIHII